MNKQKKKKIADWCNSNITGSWPVNKGANPLSAYVYLYIWMKVIA